MSQRPDFKADFFSLTRTKGLLQAEGALVLRQFFPKQLLQEWLPRFVTAVEESERQFQQGQLSESEYQNYYRFGHPLPRLVEGFELWLQALFAYLPLRHLLRQLYGPEVCIMGAYSLPRCIQPDFPLRKLDFHQDYEYIGPVQEAINIWTPLTSAGGLYPGLEVWLNGPQKPVLKLEQSQAERQAIVAKIPPAELWHPEMQAGDVLIFTPYTFHRTYLSSEMTQNRISYELRLCPAHQQEQTPTQLYPRQL